MMTMVMLRKDDNMVDKNNDDKNDKENNDVNKMLFFSNVSSVIHFRNDKLKLI